MIGRLLTQLGLDGVEQVPIENAGLFAMEDLTLKWHRTDIEAIAKEVGERPAGERNAADGLSGLQRANLVTMPRLRKSAISRFRLPSWR
jgi:hypothetical protein